VPGFVVATELDGDDRLVTFFDGAVARERLIDLDEDRRRLVWSVVDGPFRHHNASARVIPDADDPSRRSVLIWTADFLPDDLAPRMREMIALGGRAMQRAQSSAP
jgi:polyketide cyclase/dehydrase/lipid transport protein